MIKEKELPPRRYRLNTVRVIFRKRDEKFATFWESLCAIRPAVALGEAIQITENFFRI